MKTELEINGSVVQVGLDRMVIGLPYPKQPKAVGDNPIPPEQIAKFHAAKHEFHVHRKYIEDTIKDVTTYHVSKTQNKDLTRYKVLSEVDGNLLCIFSLGCSFGTGVINVEWNPSKLTAAQWAELQGLFDVFFYLGYADLYTNGVVSHAEFFVDVPGVELSSLALIDNSRRTTTKYMGTTYHGRRGARKVSTQYDKAKEQKQDGQLVRIEVRINRRDIKFRDLVESDLFNQFGNLLVVDVNRLHSVAQALNKPQLANHIIEWGLYGAVSNKPARENILKKLKEHPVAWWQPELIWEAHRNLLLNLQPEFVGGFV